MSNEVMTLCRPLVMKPVAKAALNCLADHANKDWEAWPKIPTICAETGWGRSSVITALKWLKRTGLIAAKDNPGRVTRYKFNRYALERAHHVARVAMDRGEPVQPVNPPGSQDEHVPVRGERATRPRPGPEASKQKKSNTQAIASGAAAHRENVWNTRQAGRCDAKCIWANRLASSRALRRLRRTDVQLEWAGILLHRPIWPPATAQR